MNEREKKLLIVMGVILLVIVHLLAYSYFSKTYGQMRSAYENGKKNLMMKRNQLAGSVERQDEMQWLKKHLPVEGTHASVRAKLVVDVERLGQKNHLVFKKSPSALSENKEANGHYFSLATVVTSVNCREVDLYRWLIELQSPDEARSITRIKMMPQRDDKTRVNCLVEVTQWYRPIKEVVEQ